MSGLIRAACPARLTHLSSRRRPNQVHIIFCVQAVASLINGATPVTVLANIYLWVQGWRRKRAHGDAIAMRFADDIVLGFQVKSDAERFWAELMERFRKFALELHPDKTRLLEL